MATERVEDIISKEALDSFDQLKDKVDQSAASLDKLIARGVELNKTFANIKVLKDLIDATDKLKKSEDDLKKSNDELTAAEEKLRKANEDRKKAADASRQSTIDDAKATNDNARATSTQANNLRELVDQSVKVSQALKSVSDQRKKLTKDFQDGKTSQDEYNKSLGDLLETETSLKATSTDLRGAIKNISREAESAAGSINQLESQLKVAQQVFKSLSEEDKKSELGQETQKRIQSLSDEVNRQKKSIGDFSSNVGRYAESLGGLFSGVQKEISRLNGLKVSAFNGGDPASVQRYERAIQELEGIQKIGLNTNNSYTTSVRQLQKEFITLASNGTQSAGFISEFRDQLGEAVDKQNDLRREIKLAASDTKTFDLLKSAVTGLVGAYQTGVGIVSLFGDASEDTQKTIQKLVAVQSVANGIQEIGIQLTEHNTAAFRALTYVQNLYKLAIDKSALATERFGAAFKLIGIGLIIAAVAYLIINFDKLTNTADKTKIKINELEGVSKNTKDALKLMGDTAEKIADASMKELTDAIKAMNDQLGLTPSVVEKAEASMKLLNKEIDDNNKNIKDGTSFWSLFLNGVNSVAGLASATKKSADLNDKLKDQSKLLSELTEKQAFYSHELLNVERSKAATQILKDAQDANSRLLALQKTSLDQRISLLTSNFGFEKIILERVYNDEFKAAKGSQDKEYAAKAKFEHDSLIAERNFADATEKVRKDYRERDIKAQSDTDQRSYNRHIEFNKKLAESDTELPEIRIRALQNGLQAQLQLIAEQQKRELAVDGLTEQEKQNVRDKFNTQRIQAEKDTSDKIFKIQIDYFAKFKGEQGALLKFVIKQLQNYAKEVAALFKHIGQDISQAEFAKEITDAVKQANKDIKGQFDEFGDIISELIPLKAGEDVKQYADSINFLEQKLGELGETLFSGTAKLLGNRFENEKNAIQEQINLIDTRRDKEIEAIQASQKSEQDKAAAIAIINARADSQKRIQEQRQKQISIAQARFDKAVTIAKIIAETAFSVIHQFTTGDPYTAFARAAVVGAIGIAQAAIAAATPIPTYAEGTLNHPGGLAVVGDAGRSELVVTPQGRLVETPALPTLMDLQSGSMVLPDARQAMVDYYGGMTVQKYNEMGGDNGIVNEIKLLRKDIKNKQEVHWHRKGNNWEYIVNNAGNYQKWIDQNV